MRMPARNVSEAMGILRSVAERTRVQPGCLSCRIYQDAQEEDVIMIEELWKSQEDLDRHLRSAEYRHVLLVVEMAHEQPEFRFNDVSHATGLETIERARSPDTRKPADS
jgi:quinol monooxygenase YgiN